LWVNPVISPSQSGTPAVTIENIIVSPVEGMNNGHLENISPQNTIMRKSALIDKVKNMLEDASGIEMEGVTPDMSFIEIGLDSLLLTQIALNLKKEFSCRLLSGS